MEHFRVLIVDDSLVIRGLLTNILEDDAEITVVGAAASAEEATTLLDRYQVDVVTLDVEMPGTSGMQYLPQLKRRNIPVIMLSGQAVEGSDMRGSALMLGASACFNKARAVKDADNLIRLVKTAGRGQVSIDQVDAASVTRVQDSAMSASAALGTRSDWQLLHK